MSTAVWADSLKRCITFPKYKSVGHSRIPEIFGAISGQLTFIYQSRWTSKKNLSYLAALCRSLRYLRISQDTSKGTSFLCVSHMKPYILSDYSGCLQKSSHTHTQSKSTVRDANPELHPTPGTCAGSYFELPCWITGPLKLWQHKSTWVTLSYLGQAWNIDAEPGVFWREQCGILESTSMALVIRVLNIWTPFKLKWKK